MPELDLPATDSDEARDLRSEARKVFYRNNIEAYLRNEFRISTKAIGGAQNFQPNKAQVQLIRAAQRQLKEKGKVRQLVFKCRQFGGSTYASGLISNRLHLYTGGYAFVIAQDLGTSSNIFQMYDVAYRKLSPELQRPIKYYNKGKELVLGDPNNDADDDLDTRLYVGEAKNINAGVGRTVHFLHMSEVCRFPTDDSIRESLLPACSDFPGTVRIVESTAHFGGGADWFRDQCERAMKGQSEYEYFFARWWDQPEYVEPLLKGEKLKLDTEERHLVKHYGLSMENIKWRRSRIGELRGDIDMFRLSYPIDYEEGWITKNSCTFDRRRILEMEETVRPATKRFRIVKPLNENDPWPIIEDPEGELQAWSPPEFGAEYDIGADVADGHEDGDWSVAEVIKRGTNEQVAEYRAHILPTEFGDVLAAIGRMYNHAQIAPEVNSGITVTARLSKLNYDNIYIWRKRDTVAAKFTGKLGWETTYDSKRFLVEFARSKIYYNQCIVRSKILWDELKNFGMDWTPTGMITYRAFKGHDDCVMSWMIALVISEDENFEKFVPEVETKTVATTETAFYDSVGLEPDNDFGPKVDIGAWR